LSSAASRWFFFDRDTGERLGRRDVHLGSDAVGYFEAFTQMALMSR